MRQILEVLPGALLPDPVAESDAPGVALTPPDDDDLLRPAIEEELFRVGARGSLVGASTTALAKHLVWTFGPVHAALPFPLQVRVELDGDRLVTVDPEIGFLHQGLEKAAEQCAFADVFPVLARVNPLSPLGAELTWSLAVERLHHAADRVPRRAQLWRVAALELSRMVEHLHILAVAPLSPASDACRKSLAEAARTAGGLLDGLTTGDPFRAFGGLKHPIHDDEALHIKRELPRVQQLVRSVIDAVEQRPALDEHLEGLGRIARASAVALGLSGPALRACGVVDDLRMHEPVFAYDDVPVVPVVVEGGCARARGRVRLREAAASADLVLAALARIPASAPETAIELAATPLVGTAAASLELPSGELSLLAVSDGTARPVRVRIRTASAALAAALPEILVGDRIDDVIPVIAGLGIVGTEIDR